MWKSHEDCRGSRERQAKGCLVGVVAGLLYVIAYVLAWIDDRTDHNFKRLLFGVFYMFTCFYFVAVCKRFSKA